MTIAKVLAVYKTAPIVLVVESMEDIIATLNPAPLQPSASPDPTTTI